MPIYATKDVEIDGSPKAAKSVFRVPVHLDLVKKVGSGAYGKVASFSDRLTGKQIAVKKITAAFDDLVDGRRILREVKLLRLFHHPNIISIFDIYPPEGKDFDDIYIVTDLMESDLHNVIYSRRLKLEDSHHRFFVYQLLRGLAYLHSGDVVHRDLKPANLLVNNDCDLKICDFGLSKVLNCSEEGDAFGNTDYVVTRFYRAPEVILLASKYTKSIDMWAVGCILCELINRKPIFTGKDYKDQIVKIVSALGMPSSEDLQWLPEDGVGRPFLLANCPQAKKASWPELLPTASPAARDAVEAMLRFDPTVRVEVKDALRLPYFNGNGDVEKVIASDMRLGKVDWSFDAFEPTRALLQKYIYLECARFHPELLEADCALQPCFFGNSMAAVPATAARLGDSMAVTPPATADLGAAQPGGGGCIPDSSLSPSDEQLAMVAAS